VLAALHNQVAVAQGLLVVIQFFQLLLQQVAVMVLAHLEAALQAVLVVPVAVAVELEAALGARLHLLPHKAMLAVLLAAVVEREVVALVL
jgi:hypothetical protein